MHENRINSIMIENTDGRSAVQIKTVVDATGDAVVCAYSVAKTAICKVNLLQTGTIICETEN